ncbi:MAG TPA: DegT/DnrJ/EryC1/StrS family aminotransferase [Victivallales bacterium]|nr:DegT/DnrJ/EryC1/StrS family aminotransferase [Victivallales bacterium]
MQNFIPVNEPLLDGNEKKYINECIDTGWISSEGPFVERFEKSFAEYNSRKYGIAVSNGTAALEIAVAALGLSVGDEVILPTFTIISCANAIIKAGAVPVPVDSCADTWNMNVDLIEEKITEKTKAIMAVHIYGLPVDMDPVLELAGKYNLKIIEDAAEAIGLDYKDRKCGSFGDVSTFSFYPNKHITTGEGGMILTDDEDVYGACREYRNLCFQPGKRRFVHEKIGWNYRITNIQAALGLAQLEKLDEHIIRKREIGALYQSLLSDIKGIVLPLEKTNYAENIYWVFSILIQNDNKLKTDDVCRELAKLGIGTRPFFWPIHQQPVFLKKGLFANERFSVSEYIAGRGFYIPSGLAISNEQIMIVAGALKKILIGA